MHKDRNRQNPNVSSGTNLIIALFLLQAYLCPPVVALVVINLLWKNCSWVGEIVALISRKATGFILFFLNQLSRADLAPRGPFAFLPADPFIDTIGLFFLTGIVALTVGYVRTQKVGVA